MIRALRALSAILFAATFTVAVRIEPAQAANSNCSNSAANNANPVVGPLQNVNLKCDSNGNLLTSNQAGSYPTTVSTTPYGLTLLTNSFYGLAGYSVNGGGSGPYGSGVDLLTDGPAQGPYTSSPSSYLGIPLGTPGILYVQGIGPNGTVPIYSSTGFPITDSTLTYTADVANYAAGDSKGAMRIGGYNGTATVPLIQDPTTNYLQVDCKTGCSGGTNNFPYGTGATQTGTANSFLGEALWDGAHVQPALSDTSGREIIAGAGTAGSAAGGVLTVQGSASGTAIPVSGTFYQTTQPVSGTVTANAGTGFPSTTTAGSSGTNLITVQGSASGVGIPVTGTFYQATQPVSGTVSVNALPAGTNLIGKVGIDQTTNGTTNAVAIASPLPAGTNTIGVAGSLSNAPSLTPNTSTGASAYTSGKCIGTAGTAGTGAGLMTFTSALRVNSGVLENISISFKDAQTLPVKFYLFNAAPGTGVCTDTGTPAIVAGDTGKLVGVYTLTGPDSGMGTNTIYNLDGIGKQVTSSGTSLYGYLVATGTMTLAGSGTDFTITLGVLSD